MADILDANGLTVKTFAEVLADLTDGFKNIYGQDINVDQNSPDGQMLNIIAQAAVDIRELIVAVNANFDPDTAQGSILDQRVVINNTERVGGSFTITPITITTDRTLTLPGLDGAFNSIDGTGFTVQDNSGNKFILIDTITVLAGANILNFRAQEVGRVETTAGTIQTAVTVVLGVTAINNPSGALSVGAVEETDQQLRTRRQQSVALSSAGYLNGLRGTILNLDGVTQAQLFENVTDSVDVDGIPAHGMWLIVEDGANTDIGQAIYAKKSYGANMKGAVSVPITTASGGTFTAKFDRPTAKDLYVRFDIKRTVVGFSFNQPAIKDYIVDNTEFYISDFAETSSLTVTALNGIVSLGGGGVPINMEISDDGITWVDFLPVDTLDEKWTMDVSRIAITIVA